MGSARSQGRLLCWFPSGDRQQKRRKVIPASHPDLSCRFVKESSMSKTELLADVDHVAKTLENACETCSCKDLCVRLPLSCLVAPQPLSGCLGACGDDEHGAGPAGDAAVGRGAGIRSNRAGLIAYSVSAVRN